MKDENIKEILNKWKCYIELTKKFTTNEYEMLRVEDIDKILDYITNLQEEKEMYKKEKDALMNSLFITRNKYNNDKARYRRKAKNYKQRIDKAIEYMNNYNELVVPDADIKSLILKEEYKKIIDILQGSDE